MLSAKCFACDGSDGSIFTTSVILCIVVIMLYPLYRLIKMLSKHVCVVSVSTLMKKYENKISLIRENATTYFVTVTCLPPTDTNDYMALNWPYSRRLRGPFALSLVHAIHDHYSHSSKSYPKWRRPRSSEAVRRIQSLSRASSARLISLHWTYSACFTSRVSLVALTTWSTS